LLASGAGDHDHVMRPTTFNPTIEHPGGCFTCAYFGHRVDVAVWCARPGGEHVRSQAERGCAFWEREPGSDDWPSWRETRGDNEENSR
jgi:hypothetical protein